MNDLFNSQNDFYQRLTKFVHSKVQNRDDAEEITQDILVKLIQNQKGKTIDNLSHWTFKVAKNAIIDFYRLKKIPTDSISDDMLPCEQESDDRNEVAKCLTPLIDQLSEENKSILIAVELEGLSQKKYAEQQKIPYPTAKSKIQRARKKLKEQLEKCCHLEFDKTGVPVSCNNPNSC